MWSSVHKRSYGSARGTALVRVRSALDNLSALAVPWIKRTWIDPLLQLCRRPKMPPVQDAPYATLSRSEQNEEALSVIAHHFRTPLCSIRSSAEILRDNPDFDSVNRDRFVTIVLAEEARLEALITAMLEASSIESEKQSWRVRLESLRLSGYEHATR